MKSTEETEDVMTQGVVHVRQSFSARHTFSVLDEGTLCAPPAILQRSGYSSLAEMSEAQRWPIASDSADLKLALAAFGDAVSEMKRVLANRRVVEVPEVLETPAVPTRRVLAKVRHRGPAPFVFVDDLADNS